MTRTNEILKFKDNEDNMDNMDNKDNMDNMDNEDNEDNTDNTDNTDNNSASQMVDFYLREGDGRFQIVPAMW